MTAKDLLSKNPKFIHICLRALEDSHPGVLNSAINNKISFFHHFFNDAHVERSHNHLEENEVEDLKSLLKVINSGIEFDVLSQIYLLFSRDLKKTRTVLIFEWNKII